jgi:dTDP-glucose pyrophosphorylase
MLLEIFMKAVILAAGLGTRLRPLTLETPKPMIDISGKPLLERIILDLKKHGIVDLTIVVNYMKEKIVDYFGDGKKFGVKIEYALQNNPRGGTGDAVLAAKHTVKEKYFLVITGDELKDVSVLDAILKNKNAVGYITAIRVKNPETYGVLEVDGKHVVRIREKEKRPVSNFVNISLYKFPVEIFDVLEKTPLSPRGELEVTDAINKLIEDGFNFQFVESKYYFDVSSLESLEDARKFFAKK